MGRKIGKEFSLGFQKFLIEEDNVEPHEEEEVMAEMSRIGKREVEEMARWSMNHELNTNKQKQNNYSKKTPPQQAPKQYSKPKSQNAGGSPDTQALVDEKGFGTPKQWGVITGKMGLNPDKIHSYDQLQEAFKNKDSHNKYR